MATNPKYKGAKVVDQTELLSLIALPDGHSFWLKTSELASPQSEAKPKKPTKIGKRITGKIQRANKVAA